MKTSTSYINFKNLKNSLSIQTSKTCALFTVSFASRSFLKLTDSSYSVTGSLWMGNLQESCHFLFWRYNCSILPEEWWKFTNKITSFQAKVHRVRSVVLGTGGAAWCATESNIFHQQTRVATQCCWLPSCNCRWINFANTCCSLWWHSWCKYINKTLQCMNPDYTHSIDRQDANITNIPAARLSQCPYNFWLSNFPMNLFKAWLEF